MNETLMLYLFTRINAVHGVIVVGLSVMAVSLLVWNMHRYIEEELPITVPVVWRVVAGVAVAVLVFFPSQKDLAIIVGGTYALEAARSPEAKELSGLVLDAVRRSIKEQK